MARAIIIIGHELRFHQAAENFARYLRTFTGLTQIKTVAAWDKEGEILLFCVEYQAQLAGKQPLLIAYFGHGAENGWAYGQQNAKEWLTLDYQSIANSLVTIRKGPTLIVNDCCYAERLSVALYNGFPAENQVGVIAASSVDGYCFGSLGLTVVAAWHGGKAYEPRSVPAEAQITEIKETRSGPVFDHHFFPPAHR